MDETVHAIVKLFAQLIAETNGENAIAVAEQQRDKPEQHELVRETWAKIVEELKVIGGVTRSVNLSTNSKMKH